jgi:lipoprotein NlpI
MPADNQELANDHCQARPTVTRGALFFTKALPIFSYSLLATIRRSIQQAYAIYPKNCIMFHVLGVKLWKAGFIH